MPASAGDRRWVDAGAVALRVGVGVPTVWFWARAGQVVARRLPGRRGRVRIAVDAEGWPVPAARPPPRRSRP